MSNSIIRTSQPSSRCKTSTPSIAIWASPRTGFRLVSGWRTAVDDASSFAIAQGIRGQIKAFAAVSQGIANARGVATVALAGANAISDLLGDIQAKIPRVRTPATRTAQQAILNADFSNLNLADQYLHHQRVLQRP